MRCSAQVADGAHWLKGMLIAAGLSLASGGHAQQVDEITVTARKKEESLQEVPLSITAFTADALRQRNIENIYNLAEFTPNFSLTRNLGRRLDAPSIRGQFTPLVGTEPNAAFYVDGVFVTGSASSLVIDNLERVEILRGPQAALFGRSSFAGAVNYITRKPTNEFTGEINLKAAENQNFKTAAWASGPIVQDKLLFFGSASWQSYGGEWRNGLQPNEVNVTTDINTSLSSFFGPFTWPVVPGQNCPPGYLLGCPPQEGDNTRLGGEETVNFTGKLTWMPTDRMEFSLKIEDIAIRDDHFASIYIPPYERQFDENGNLILNEFGFADLKTNLNARLPVYDPVNEIYIGSPGWYQGQLKPGNFVSKLNLPNIRNGVTTNFGTSPASPFLGQEEDIRRYALEGTFDLGGDWTAVARWTQADIDQEYYRDLDRTPALGPLANGLFEASERYELEDRSAEVRIQSPADRRLSGLFGAFYYNRAQNFRQRNFNGFDGIELNDGYAQDIDNFALFGSLSFAINDRWTASVEARYASDDITWRSNAKPEVTFCDSDNPNHVFPGEPAFYCDPVTANETYYSFTPRFTLEYSPADNLNFYALAALGNKPGGFNFPYFDSRNWRPDAWRALEDEAVIEEEEAWTYEIGAKSELAGGALVLNGAFFYIDWKNQAINITEAVAFEGGAPAGGAAYNPANNNLTPFNIIDNAGKSHVIGVELEATWAATDYLTLAASYGWARNELDEYFDDELSTLNCNLWGWSGFRQNGPFRGTLSDEEIGARCFAAGDASGKLAPRVPEHSANASANYYRPLSGRLNWFARTDLNFESKKYNTVANLAHTGEMYIWNARVGLDSDRWTLTFFLDNILDDDTPELLQDFPVIDESQYQRWNQASTFAFFEDFSGRLVNPTGFQLTPRRSRTYGALVQYRFGS